MLVGSREGEGVALFGHDCDTTCQESHQGHTRKSNPRTPVDPRKPQARPNGLGGTFYCGIEETRRIVEMSVCAEVVSVERTIFRYTNSIIGPHEKSHHTATRGECTLGVEVVIGR